MTLLVCVRPSGQGHLCYLPNCGKVGTVRCDHPVDCWGRTCDRYVCHKHSEPVGWNRDYCLEHVSRSVG